MKNRRHIMRTLKGWITTTCLAALLSISVSTANGGVIIGGLIDQPCTDDTKGKVAKTDIGVIIGGIAGTGVIIGGLTGTGVIIGGLTGVIIGGLGSTDETAVNCGVIIGG